MAKLGYTWYPKDWNNSESVFQLNLTQRGLYRELIDLAYLNDNKTIINLPVWSRKWNISEDDLKVLIQELKHIKLIEHKGDNLFILSCESRLQLVRGGSKGGSKSKPTNKGKGKPTPKPDSNQRESKEKLKEKKEAMLQYFLAWGKENSLNDLLVTEQFARAWAHYEIGGFKNKHGADISETAKLKQAILSQWFKDLDELKVKIDPAVTEANRQVEFYRKLREKENKN